MKNFIYLYHNTQNSKATPEQYAAFEAWFSNLGDKVVDSGSPINKNSLMVVKDGQAKPGTDTVIGYAVIKANDISEAVALTKGNPLAITPTTSIHVYEMVDM